MCSITPVNALHLGLKYLNAYDSLDVCLWYITVLCATIGFHGLRAYMYNSHVLFPLAQDFLFHVGVPDPWWSPTEQLLVS
jgi:hypothetical protein